MVYYTCYYLPPIQVFVVRLDPDNKTTQYCLWLNNEYTLNHVRKRLIAKIPAIKHLLFVDVENRYIPSLATPSPLRYLV